MEPRLTGLGLPVELVTPGAGSFPHNSTYIAQQINQYLYSILTGLKDQFFNILTIYAVFNDEDHDTYSNRTYASRNRICFHPSYQLVTTIGKSHPATQKEGKLRERKRRQP
jgi:hypothetical protein